MYGHVSIFFIHEQILHLAFYINNTPFNSNISSTLPEILFFLPWYVIFGIFTVISQTSKQICFISEQGKTVTCKTMIQNYKTFKRYLTKNYTFKISKISLFWSKFYFLHSFFSNANLAGQLSNLTQSWAWGWSILAGFGLQSLPFPATSL